MLGKSWLRAVLIAAMPMLLGIEACTEPKEYCKLYKNRSDRDACSTYCESNKDFANNEKELLACRAGQLIFLSDPQKDSVAAGRECDQQTLYSAKDVQIACRAGVAAETTRYAKYKKEDPGTAGGDRETGNRGGSKQRF